VRVAVAANRLGVLGISMGPNIPRWLRLLSETFTATARLWMTFFAS